MFVLGDLAPWVREIVSVFGHWTYPDTGTVHKQVVVRKVWGSYKLFRIILLVYGQ